MRCPRRLDGLSFRPLVQRAQAGETVRGEDCQIARGDQGAQHWVRVSCAPATEAEGGIWLLVVDVAERRSLDILHEQVLGVVAHDLRNPMSALRMTLAMLAKKTEMPLERRLTLAERMMGTLGRMEALVNTLAEHARAEAGVDVRLHRASGNVGLIYDRVQQDLEVLYPGRVVEVQRRGDLEGFWDLPRLERVLSHVVGNALKHGSEEAPVNLVLDGAAPDRVRITVRNQGLPIPPDFLPLVYEPFTTGAIDKNGRRRAIGLGLFIVRHLVNAHGGAVRLESTEAAGTTVTVDIPRGDRAQDGRIDGRQEGRIDSGSSSGELPATGAEESDYLGEPFGSEGAGGGR